MKFVFQAFQILFGYLGSYSIKKRNIFIFYIISNIFSALMFWSVGNFAAILPVLSAGIRYLVFIFKDKYKTKLPLILCIIMHLTIFIISIKTLLGIIPSILVILACLAYWYYDEAKLKKSIFIINIPWIVYYIYCGLYLAGINAIIHNILFAIAYLKIIKKDNKKNTHV